MKLTGNIINFEGHDLRPGDRAKWVRVGASSCGSENDVRSRA
jgi:hypothetical protein